MFFVLGVLVATLVALMVLPAIWHRAVRLTTRRIEAAVPTSIFEIHADKDLQRAGFALNQRRLEIQIETLRDELMRDARILEEHRLAAVDLGHQLAARTQDIASLTAERDDLAARLAQTERTLEDRVAALAETSIALAAREADVQDRQAALSAARQALSAEEGRTASLAAALAEREKELAVARAEAATRAEDVSLVRQRLADIAERIARSGPTAGDDARFQDHAQDLGRETLVDGGAPATAVPDRPDVPAPHHAAAS